MPVPVSGVSAYDVILEKIKELHEDLWRFPEWDHAGDKTAGIEALCDVLQRLAPGMSQEQCDLIIQELSILRVREGWEQRYLPLPYEAIDETISHLKE